MIAKRNLYIYKILAMVLIVVVAVAFSFMATPDTAHAASKDGKKKIKVTFNVNGGKAIAKSARTKSVTVGKKLGKLPTVKRTGNKFTGWYNKKSGGKKFTANTKIKKAVKLYAHWKVRSYTLTFDANGGTVATKSKKATYGKRWGALPKATRAGYTFKGWRTAKSGGSEVTEETTVPAKDLTTYASWEATVPAPAPVPEEKWVSFAIDNGEVIASDKPGNLVYAGGERVVYTFIPGTTVTIKAVAPVNPDDGTIFHQWGLGTEFLLAGYRFADGFDGSTETTKVVTGGANGGQGSIEAHYGN